MKTKNKIMLVAVALMATAIAILWATKAAGTEIVPTTPPKTLTTDPCLKVVEGHGNYLGEYDCTEDIATVKKWAAYERSLKSATQEPRRTLKALITHYGRADSCHNPKTVYGKTLCLTAIGQDTQEGVTVACPRDIALGTKVEINGRTYVCQDRYAKYLDAKRGVPTFDVFYEADSQKPVGNQIAIIKILK